MLLPLFIILLDKSYHLLKDGTFVSTPFTNICLSGSTFYVSELSDLEDIKNQDDIYIFNDCYAFLKENNWLLSSKERKSYDEYYNHFHNNLGNICNYTVHDRGRKYYIEKGYNAVDASIAIENTSKRISHIIIKNNFQKWIRLYYSNLVHSFKSQIILYFIIILFLISGINVVKSKSNTYTFLCLFSALILSNAMLVAFASHSIMRYLFYNFALFYLILLLLTKLFWHGKKP
jgi:O-antigen ligase